MPVKFKAEVDTKALESIKKKTKQLKKPVTRDFARQIGRVIVKEMKRIIKRGVNPIKGWGKFPAYRGKYRKQIQKKGYVNVDGERVSKKLRPVNLKLTGKFLSTLTSKAEPDKTGFSAVVRYKTDLSEKKEDGHRTGHNEQAERPTIPQKKLREDFQKSISDKYIRLFNKAIKRVTDKKR